MHATTCQQTCPLPPSYHNNYTTLCRLLALELPYNQQAVETLLQAGADPNIADTTHGWSPLHLAVRLKNNTIAKLLITKGTTCCDKACCKLLLLGARVTC